MDRKLINYLPPVLREKLDFKAINAANEPEISLAWDALALVMANQFPDSADEQGVAVWEGELRITPKDTEGLETRKTRIRALQNLELPYSVPRLKSWLEAVCGPGNYVVEQSAYILGVKIALTVKANYDGVDTLLKMDKPVQHAC